MSYDPSLAPMDTHNRRLLSNVHPADWQNPEPDSRYNLVVIGAGTAGLVTSAAASGLGARVALIERELMGGDCLNVGCVPSKALIQSSRVQTAISEANQFGVTVPTDPVARFEAVMERLRRLRADISRHDSVHRYREMGIDVFLGEARFTGRQEIQVDDRTLRFKKAVIATGARAVRPPIEGLKEAGFFTNENIFNLTQQPARLAVIGGGPIGCELSQAFCRLGSEVHLIEMQAQFLAREDQDAAAILKESMERDGVKIRLDTKLERVEAGSSGKKLHLESGGHKVVLEVDEILVGVGRRPNVDSLDLDKAGVEYDGKSGVKVNERLQTTNSRIFAAGDVAFAYKFTHTADATARIVVENALFLGRKKTSTLTIPWCTYTTPEIAHVGLGEKEAREQGLNFQSFKIPLGEVDRAVLDGETEGFVKILTSGKSDKILGATVVAHHAGEMISEITLAMVAGTGLKTISSVIHPYPTQAEAIRKAADAYNRQRLTPLVKKIFGLWFWLTR